MALQKEIIFTNGVNIKYHRIDDISLDNKNKVVNITVVSYTDKTYRDKEIENTNNNDRYEELLNLIMTENTKPETDRNVEQVKIWSDEANSLISKFQEKLDLSVIKNKFQFKNVTDLSMTNLYTLLKQEELFKDAINI